MSMLRRLLLTALAGLVFIFAWFFRFNDPDGAYAGLTDDHFFYVVRGWQILFGELPVRDFVDHGAPLHYYIAAAVQVLFGRGTLSELVFSVTVLAASAALVFLAAARASGSALAGLAGAAFLVLLEPRFYNYPKILVYAVGIPALWWFASRRDARSHAALAVTTVIGFLLRHDHGAFLALAVAALLLLASVSWRERAQHAAAYAVLVTALLAPYLAFIQTNGGLATYLEQAASWAARDRARAEVVFPGVLDVAPELEGGGPVERIIASVQANRVAWVFYLELALPILALIVLPLSPVAFRPGWPQARAKIAVVAVLGILLDAGFLRGPLEARLADPAVPHAILFAWLLGAVLPGLGRRSRLQPALQGRQARPIALRISAALAIAAVAALATVTIAQDLGQRLGKAALDEGWNRAVERAGVVVDRVHPTWPLGRWTRPESGVMGLAFYLEACTAPTDRVFVQGYLPQVLALGRRGFAGGHADLRPGFFTAESAQRLTLERLRRQSVPVVLLATGRNLENFRAEFPLISAYFDEAFVPVGERFFDASTGVTLLVARSARPSGTFAPLGWPCFR